MSLNNPSPGYNWAAEFAVSAIPWVTSSVLIGSECRKIAFYGITKEVVVKNLSGSALQVGFTFNGAQGSNNISLQAGESFAATVRVKELYVFGTGNSFCVFAGLTGILAQMMPPLTGSSIDGVG